MRITVPKVIRPLKVSEYAEEFGELAISVWVNPPRELLSELIECLRAAVKTSPQPSPEGKGVTPSPLPSPLEGEGAAKRAVEIIAELWSQGSDPETHWTAEELMTLASETIETDPKLWPWLRERTFELIGQHRNQEKKKIRDGLLDLTSSDPHHRGTKHPLLGAILLAQRINRVSGGAVIAPWEIDQLPDTWLDAFVALTDDLPEIRAARAEAEKAVEDAKKRLAGK